MTFCHLLWAAGSGWDLRAPPAGAPTQSRPQGVGAPGFPVAFGGDFFFEVMEDPEIAPVTGRSGLAEVCDLNTQAIEQLPERTVTTNLMQQTRPHRGLFRRILPERGPRRPVLSAPGLSQAPAASASHRH